MTVGENRKSGSISVRIRPVDTMRHNAGSSSSERSCQPVTPCPHQIQLWLLVEIEKGARSALPFAIIRPQAAGVSFETVVAEGCGSTCF